MGVLQAALDADHEGSGRKSRKMALKCGISPDSAGAIPVETAPKLRLTARRLFDDLGILARLGETGVYSARIPVSSSTTILMSLYILSIVYPSCRRAITADRKRAMLSDLMP